MNRMMMLSMKRFLFLFIICASITPSLQAQLGGARNMSFLRLPTSTQQLALGGYQMSNSCQDVSMHLTNPALLTDSISDWLTVNYQNYHAGIQGGNMAYAKELKRGFLGVGVRYLNYGNFDAYDPIGNYLGDFRATDYALQASYAIKHKVYSLGISVKWVQSSIEQYQSSALLFDIGGTFQHPKKDFSIGWVAKNIGFRMSKYAEEGEFVSPVDVQIGLSVKPEHMPLRLHLTAHHLHDFNIAYKDPTLDGKFDALGNPLQEQISFADKLARHFAIGGEFVISKSLGFQMGYNIWKRREMTLAGLAGTVGFSWGLVFRTNRWQASYGRDAAFIGNGVSQLSFSFMPTKLFKKKSVIH